MTNAPSYGWLRYREALGNRSAYIDESHRKAIVLQHSNVISSYLPKRHAAP
jgi:hypothetical protein